MARSPHHARRAPGLCLGLVLALCRCALAPVAQTGKEGPGGDAVGGVDLAARCTAAVVQAVAPAGVKVGPISNLNRKLPPVPTGALLVPADGSTPAYCLVTGSVVTNPATGKTANFGAALPLAWNNRFLFTGCSGLCGVVFDSLPGEQRGGGFPPDVLARGYALLATDDGHATTPPGFVFDATWALEAPGEPDEEALTDYFYRAVHAVTVAGKQLVQSWYTRSLQHAYFFGCSDGGREGMVEATRYPEDFDGYIVGAPFFDIPGELLAGRAARALLDAPDAYIPPELLAQVDRAITASCDAVDGVTDGLIQNPGRCAFQPEALLCGTRRPSGCLTESQVRTLNVWFSPAVDAEGRVVSFGFSVSDLSNLGGQGANLFAFAEGAGPPQARDSADPWGADVLHQPLAWVAYSHTPRYMVFLDPTFDANRDSPVDRSGVVSEAAMVQLESRTREGNGNDPRKLGPFLASGRKLLLYHGDSDGYITPFQTVRFYEDWARLVGGDDVLGKSARLFMVPGMYHCSGGPGPNTFDALGVLERWVENGEAPAQVVATKYTDDDRTQAVLRTMPLCPFPTQARYLGAGPVNDASSWSCEPNSELRKLGPNGTGAGLSGALR